MTEPFNIAAIVTTFPSKSHAQSIVGKFFRGFPTDGGLIKPRTRVVSMFIDQLHEQDIGLQLAHEHGVAVYESIRGALTLGTGELAVDAVLIIGEHGDYPKSALGQEMLPRRYFFEQVCGVIGESGKPVPVFTDKHFSYRWDDARWMYETAKDMGVPLWAASAVPVSWRRPNLDHPLGEPIDEALSIGFHMLERYGFHALEALQCQVERRAGGETGVEAVQCLSGEDVWRAGEEGLWSVELANRALGAIDGGPGELDRDQVEDPHVFLVTYRDGLRASVLVLGDTGYVNTFAYAARRGSSIDSLEYATDSGPATAAFGYLGLNIEDFFLTGRAPTPVERTYLTTGVLEAAMVSNGAGGKRIETPYLDIQYAPGRTPPRRPEGPRATGVSVGPWPLPEPGGTEAAVPIRSRRDGTVRRGQES